MIIGPARERRVAGIRTRGTRPERKMAATSRTPAAGYSGTPLAKKLGIGAGDRVLVIGAPDDYRTLFDALPERVSFARSATAAVNLAHVFVARRQDLAAHLKALRLALSPHAVLWVSWPKKSAGVPTTVTEDVVRDEALPLGFVDVKVCAVDDVWSGLKLVVRKELRQQQGTPDHRRTARAPAAIPKRRAP
jgi:hypothetical protein